MISKGNSIKVLLLVIMLFIYCLPLGYTEGTEKDADRWHMLYDSQHVLIQLDTTAITSRLTDRGYNVLYWSRMLTKKDNTVVYLHKEYLTEYDTGKLKMRIIQGYSETHSNTEISDWSIVNQGSLDYHLFNEVLGYDMDKRLSKVK